MEKMISKIFADVLVILTFAGLVLPKRKKRLFGLMNVDTTHSMLRIPLTAAMLYAASNQTNLKMTRNILTGFGIFYVAMGTAGLIDRKVGGLLPSELTTFDLIYHFSSGAAALWLGQRSGRMMKD